MKYKAATIHRVLHSGDDISGMYFNRKFLNQTWVSPSDFPQLESSDCIAVSFCNKHVLVVTTIVSCHCCGGGGGQQIEFSMTAVE